MATVTEPLREEHRGLLPHIERLKEVGDLVGASIVETLRHGVDEVHAFLTHDLIPHAEAEEAALYPVVARVMGAPETTATMSRDHVEVGALTRELSRLRDELHARAGGPNEEQQRELRRILYGLYALVKVHFAKEEEVYLPILDERLSASEAEEMFEAMHHAAAHHAH